MEKRSCSPGRRVYASEPLLAEESTPTKLPLSLTVMLEQLGENATRRDYLVALLLVLLGESGFCVLAASDAENQYSGLRAPQTSSQIRKDKGAKATDDSPPSYKNTRLIRIPRNWKSETEEYKVCFALPEYKRVQRKLIVVPMKDRRFLDISVWTGDVKICSMDTHTAKYVCANPSNPHGRYKNLKRISQRFKDCLATPTRTGIWSSLGLMNPSLQGLPDELLQIIISMLSNADMSNLEQCLSELYSAKPTVQSEECEKKLREKIFFHISKIIPEICCSKCKKYKPYNSAHNSKSDCISHRIKRYYLWSP